MLSYVLSLLFLVSPFIFCRFCIKIFTRTFLISPPKKSKKSYSSNLVDHIQNDVNSNFTELPDKQKDFIQLN